MSDSDFNTPPWFLDIVRRLDKRGIGLDPCSNEYSTVRARTSYTVEDDGLSHSWRGHGLVYVNPPHSMAPNNIEPWMEKAHREFALERPNRWDPSPDQLVMLIPSKTDTIWFHSHAITSDAKCFLKGRIKFWHQGVERAGSGKFASLVLYWGRGCGGFMTAFDGTGFLV